MEQKQTPLYDVHVKHQGKMVEFAGYSMPIQYADGVISEHEWVRQNAGIFDVSHMGQVVISGEGASEFISKVTPSLFNNTPNGRAKYTVLTNEDGGIIDDLIITRLDEDLFFAVINAGCKEKDIEWMQSHMPESVSLERLDDRALIALQGPKAESVLAELLPNLDVANLRYMSLDAASYKGSELFVSRLGYTGEDGFEISIKQDLAPDFWEALLENESVKEIGLGARDTLRLEMGYPLYGHDIDTITSPIEADLGWVVAKNNQSFIGAEQIHKEKAEGVMQKRVGIRLIDKGVAREGAEIFNENNEEIGVVTSGGFSPSLKQSIGQGYVESDYAQPGTKILVKVRGRYIKTQVEKLPFVSPKTKSVK